MLLNGVAPTPASAFDKVFDGELGLEAWIPFGNDLDGAYAQINGSATVPLADLSQRRNGQGEFAAGRSGAGTSGDATLGEIDCVAPCCGSGAKEPTALKACGRFGVGLDWQRAGHGRPRSPPAGSGSRAASRQATRLSQAGCQPGVIIT